MTRREQQRLPNRWSTARFCRILAALALLAAAPIRAQTPPRLIADLKTAPGPPNPYPSYVLTSERLGGAVYFFADDGRHGREIWRTDGTAAGTALFADLCPGTCSFDGVLTRVEDRLFALGKDGSGGLTLFSLDGTAAGTRVVRRFSTVSESIQVRPVAFDGHLWWTMAEPSLSQFHLWQSDGTFDGTRAVELPGCAEGCTASLAGPLVAGNVLYFQARDKLFGAELWRTDGTAAGTFRTADLCPGSCNGVAYLFAVVAGDRLFFAGNDGTVGDEVWTIGGGEPAPRLVADFNPGPQGSAPTFPYPFAIGNEAYFNLHAGATFQRRLYRTTGNDLTAASEYEPYGADQSPGMLHSDGDGRVFFSVIGPTGAAEIWVRGPGSQPSRKLAGDLTTPIFLGSVNGTTLFYAFGNEAQLWATDATPAGTRRVGAWRPSYPAAASSALAVGGGLLLLLDDGVHGYEPWISDGTVAGTLPLGDLNLESSSNPGRIGGFAALGSDLYFGAFDGSDLYSPRLFRASGDPPTVASAQVGLVSEIETAGGHAFALRATQAGLVATDAVTGPVVVSTGYPGRLMPWGGLLAFGGPTDFRTLQGQGLWVSDGTAAGTRLVFDVFPDQGPGGDCLSPYYGCEFVLYPAGLTPVGPSLYFIGYSEYGPDGEQLFRTDGTTAGTVALLSTNVEAAERSFQSLLPYGKGVAFVTLAETYAPQGTANPDAYELWASDGAPESTRLLLSTLDRLSLLGAAGSRVLFGRRPVGSAEDELWTSDGTAAGTALLSRLSGAGNGSRITGESTARSLATTLPGTEVASSIVAEGRVFFTVADNLTGEELWVSDGTTAGTRRVADLFAGAAGSHPTNLTPYRACAVFAASDGLSGHELWASDGIKAWQVADVASGSGASSPGPMAAAGAFFYFAADDGTHGRELFAISTADLDARCSGAPPPPPPPPPLGEWLTTPEVPGFRFKVQLGAGDTATNGTQTDCVAATLCVAGARAGRAEVLARVVGPKPNGRLWPTLIALTPTEVQVWVEQVATGEIRYYRLPAAGGSTLAGMIDRTGFASHAGAAAVSAGDTAGLAADPSGWLTTPELPGFRFRVQLFLGSRSQSTRLEPCLTETLCVSGAVAGRPEVFVRVTGTRPNGRRWVALARTTTSRVEVDVEQIASGEVRHFSLPGLSSASGRIEGLLDRVGFRP